MQELENLWYKYLIENSFSPNNEINIIAKELTEAEKKLKDALLPEDKDIFYRYEKCLNELNSISEKKCFHRRYPICIKIYDRSALFRLSKI